MPDEGTRERRERAEQWLDLMAGAGRPATGGDLAEGADRATGGDPATGADPATRSDLATGDDPAVTGTASGSARRLYLLPVLSGSMRPDIPVGATLGISTTARAAPRDGDVIVFRQGDALVAHRRLWAVTAGPLALIYQKGDASPRGGWIDRKAVVGRVVELRLPDGEVRDLTTLASRQRALVQARRSLAADLRHRLRALLRPRKG
jgi:hypothetical protein